MNIEVNNGVFTCWLKKEISARNLSYRKFAKLIGINVSYLSLILAGKRNPSMEFILKLVTTLNVSLSFMLSITGHIPDPPLAFSSYDYFEYIESTCAMEVLGMDNFDNCNNFKYISNAFKKISESDTERKLTTHNLVNLFYLWGNKEVFNNIVINYFKFQNKIIKEKQFELALRSNLSLEIDLRLFFKYHVHKIYPNDSAEYIFTYSKLLGNENFSTAFRYAPNAFILYLCQKFDIEEDLFFFLTGRYRKELLIKLPLQFRKKISNYMESLTFTEKVKYVYKDYKFSTKIHQKELGISDEFRYYIRKYLQKDEVLGQWDVFFDYYLQLKTKSELFGDNINQTLDCNIEQPFSIIKKGDTVQVMLNLPEKEYFAHANTINTLCSLCKSPLKEHDG